MECAEKSHTLARIRLVPHVPEDVIDPGQLTGILGRHKAFGSQTGDGQLDDSIVCQKEPSGPQHCFDP